jgi:hypothetical protein
MTNEELKRTLWDTANKLRGSVSAAEYKYPVLGMVFLKYVSDLFDAQSNVIRQRIAEPGSDYYIEDEATRRASEDAFVGDKTFYDQDNVFWIPKGRALQHAAGPGHGCRICRSCSTRRWVRSRRRTPRCAACCTASSPALRWSRASSAS